MTETRKTGIYHACFCGNYTRNVGLCDRCDPQTVNESPLDQAIAHLRKHATPSSNTGAHKLAVEVLEILGVRK